MNLLFVVPDLSNLGGVASHYSGLHNYWTFPFSYEYYGKRKGIPAIICFPFDILKYIFKLMFYRIDIVIVNPSLRRYQLIRDGIYILLAKLFCKKVVTFIHGWDTNLAPVLVRKPRLFKFVYNKSSLIFVLSGEFKKELFRMGITCPIRLTTTKVDDKLLKTFDVNHRTGEIKQILFLARIIKTKGVFITLDTFRLLKKEFPYLKLLVCGDGADLVEAEEYILQNHIEDVILTGAISGNTLIDAFKNSDLYILPSYEEGMATSILEAMAFGLPIVSRPVGGIVDYFIEGKMGHLISTFNPQDFYECIRQLILNPKLIQTISETNYLYALKHFLASTVAKDLEKILSEQFLQDETKVSTK